MPASARTYELVSVCRYEAAGIVCFVMGIDQPRERVKQAIQSPVAWCEECKIEESAGAGDQ